MPTSRRTRREGVVTSWNLVWSSVKLSRVRTLVATEFLMLAGLLAFVGIAYGVEVALSLDAPINLNALSSLLLAGIPALLWLSYFYVQDRHEEEPKGHVLGMYILGAFVAGPSAAFIVDLSSGSFSPILSFSVLAPERWIYAIAIVGIAQELSKYLVVRYTLYVSPEFDEPIDGIVYLTAAGIGFATYQSYQFLQSAGGEIYLSAGAAQCVVTALAHASFAGVMGFALGRAKFSPGKESHRSTALVIGLLTAAVLNGCFRMIMDALSVQGLSSSPWHRVFFSFGFAAGVFLLTSILMRKHLAASPHAAKESDA